MRILSRILSRILLSRILILIILCLAGISTSFSQILDPVEWKKPQAIKQDGNEYLLIFSTKRIDPGWKIYGNKIKPGGPIPTEIYFDQIKGFELVGDVEELGLKPAEYDEFFDMSVPYFEKRAVLRQKIRLTQPEVIVKGYLEFMTCDATQCLPPDEVPFKFNLTGSFAAKTSGTPDGDKKPDDNGSKSQIDNGKGGIGAIDTGDDIEDTAEAAVEDTLEDTLSGTEIAQANEKEGSDGKEKNNKSLWGFLLAGFGGGLIALVTPCVFPMIPLTVAFFTKSSKDRKKGFANAILYALSIILIFISLGFIITLAFGPGTLNEMASNKYFNVAFFLIFIFFALSFFGVFDLTLPSGFVNKVDSASDRGGLIGIFFMAFTLVLVSFSCTAPLIGSLLVLIADSGQFWAPLMGFLGFSLALAIPFALFAAFPGWLNSLPKSGGWLNTIKVSLGFIELGLALKFLSVADLAYHWNLLSRDIFIAFWVIISILWGLYLLDVIRFSHDKKKEFLSVPRLFVSILTFAFAIYLVPGLWGAPRSLLSGIAPPESHQEFSINHLQYKFLKLEEELASMKSSKDIDAQPEFPENYQTHVTGMKCPHSIDCIFDYKEGIEYARKVRKPVLIDFTGWSCVNCRKMEENVWSNSEVWSIIQNEYVLVSLYVDEKTGFDDGPLISEYTGSEVKNIGKLWADLQRKWFGTNAQPWYVLLDPHHEVHISETGRAVKNMKLVEPKGYTPNVDDYVAFLKSGIEAFNKKYDSTSSPSFELSSK